MSPCRNSQSKQSSQFSFSINYFQTFSLTPIIKSSYLIHCCSMSPNKHRLFSKSFEKQSRIVYNTDQWVLGHSPPAIMRSHQGLPRYSTSTKFDRLASLTQVLKVINVLQLTLSNSNPNGKKFCSNYRESRIVESKIYEFL